MTFQPCPGIASVVLNFSLPDGQQAVNAFNVSNDVGDPWGNPDFALLAGAFQTWYEAGDGAGATYRSRVATAVTLDSIVCRDLGEEGGAEYSLSVGDAGEETTAQLNNGLTLAISARTGNSGRSFRGRSFVVGLTTASLETGDQNKVNAAYVTEQLLAWNALLTTVTGYGGENIASVCVLSRFNKDAVPTPPHKRDTGIGTSVLNYTIVDTNVDFQRRRAPGHNRHH